MTVRQLVPIDPWRFSPRERIEIRRPGGYDPVDLEMLGPPPAEAPPPLTLAASIYLIFCTAPGWVGLAVASTGLYWVFH